MCTRSGSHPYNLSLVAAMIEHEGEAKAEAWAKGVVANFARKPQGGDSDQIKAVAAGECAVAITNTYYYARILRSDKPEDREIAAKTGVVFPSLAGRGTHVNISGGAVLKHAPHPENAVRFLEYLASESAQRYFADGNNEWASGQGREDPEPGARPDGPLRRRPHADRSARAQQRRGAEGRRSRRLALMGAARPRAPGVEPRSRRRDAPA